MPGSHTVTAAAVVVSLLFAGEAAHASRGDRREVLNKEAGNAFAATEISKEASRIKLAFGGISGPMIEELRLGRRYESWDEYERFHGRRHDYGRGRHRRSTSSRQYRGGRR